MIQIHVFRCRSQHSGSKQGGLIRRLGEMKKHSPMGTSFSRYEHKSLAITSSITRMSPGQGIRGQSPDAKMQAQVGLMPSSIGVA